MLLHAMQACGAIFVKTAVARAFVEKTLATCRELLIHEFVSLYLDDRYRAHAFAGYAVTRTQAPDLCYHHTGLVANDRFVP
jgi:hypothetical protein